MRGKKWACLAGSVQSSLLSFLCVFRIVYRAQEAALSRSMERHRKSSPTEMGIPSKLLPQGRLPKGEGPPPYWVAVQELLLLPLSSCPQRKLECIGEAWGWSAAASPRRPNWRLVGRAGIWVATESTSAVGVGEGPWELLPRVQFSTSERCTRFQLP